MRAVVIACCFAGSTSLAAAQERRPAASSLQPTSTHVRSIDTGGRVTSSLAFSPDGRVIAAAKGKQVHFWSTTTGKDLRNAWTAEEFLEESARSITFLTFLNSQSIALMAEPSNVVYIRKYPSAEELGRIDLGKGTLVCLATADGVIASATTILPGRCSIRVWAGSEWKEPIEILLADGYPGNLDFSADHSELAVGTRGNVRVYRVKDGKELRVTNMEGTGGLGLDWARVAYSPNGRDMAVAVQRLRSIKNTPISVELWDAQLKTARVGFKWDKIENAGSVLPCQFQFTPDAKTLVVLCADRKVRFFESQTGGFRHAVPLPGILSRPVLSPDGRFLALRNNDWGKWVIELIDWRSSRERIKPLAAAELNLAWSDLASPDSGKGFRAVVSLGASPAQAVKLIGQNLKPIPPLEANVIKTLIANLGSEEYAVRETATEALKQNGDSILPELRAAARDELPERRDRATKLLGALSRRDSPKRLRSLRAIEILEYVDTPTGRDVLKSLASGEPGAPLTVDAKAALARLVAPDPKP